ncbi:MAG: hemerythrin domain-containing protein [Legionella sp.]|uniref:hemerythrin domain-containing protein n=1 Tax=Legionella sp. TaxID=459 RepID=UPI0039E5D67B
MNAIEFLIKEHDKVRTTLDDIANGSHHFDTQKKRFELLIHDLIRHEKMEYTVWYPHFKNEVPDTVKHLLKEEKSAEKEIKKIDGLKTEAAWKEHFIKFKQDVEHHAQEEEKKLFPEVKKILTEKQLLEIGLSMLVFKKEYSE